MKKKTILSQLLLLGFLLGIHNGKIALWKDQDPEPYRVFPYSAMALPPQVRQALESGIYIDSEADLEKLLENFLS